MQRKTRYASRIGAVVAAGALAAGVTAASAATQTPAATRASAAPAAKSPGWRVVARFGPAEAGAIGEIAASGANDAWITGATQAGLAIRHWHNGKWQRMAVPVGFRTSSVESGPVDSSSASNMWTFPLVVSSTWATQYALRWNGKAWSKFAFNDVFAGTTAVFGAKNVWMFGLEVHRSGATAPYAARYNGRTWQRVATPGGVVGVSKISARDMWAYGPTAKTVGGSNWTYTTMHWNGSKWRAISLPKLAPVKKYPWAVDSIVALSDRNVWLSESPVGDSVGVGGGHYVGPPPGVVLLHWNGKSWHIAARNNAYFFGGLGYDGNGGFWLPASPLTSQPGTNYLVHYRGGRWSRQATPKVRGFSNSEGQLIHIPGTRSLWGTGSLDPVPGPAPFSAVIVKFGR